MPSNIFIRVSQVGAFVLAEILDVPHEWSHLRACNRSTKDSSPWDLCHAAFRKRFSSWTYGQLLSEVYLVAPRGPAVMWMLHHLQPCASKVQHVLQELLRKKRVRGWILFHDVGVQDSSHVEVVDDSDTECEQRGRLSAQLDFIRSNMIRWGVMGLLIRSMRFHEIQEEHYSYGCLCDGVDLLVALKAPSRVRYHCIDFILLGLNHQAEKRKVNGRHGETCVKNLLRCLNLFLPSDAHYMQGKNAGRLIISLLVSYKFCFPVYKLCRDHVCRLQDDAADALNSLLRGLAVVISEEDGDVPITTFVMDDVMTMCSSFNDMPVKKPLLWGVVRALVKFPRWKAWMIKSNIGGEIVSSISCCISEYMWSASTEWSIYGAACLNELLSGIHTLALVLEHDPCQLRSGIAEVANAMTVFSSELLVQRLGCSFLSTRLVEGNAGIAHQFAAYKPVLRAMRCFQDDPILQRYGCNALFALCCCSDARLLTVQEGGVDIIWTALFNFAGGLDMQYVMEHAGRIRMLEEQASALENGKSILWQYQGGKKMKMRDCSREEHELYEAALWKGDAFVQYSFHSVPYLITIRNDGGSQKNLKTGKVRNLTRMLV